MKKFSDVMVTHLQGAEPMEEYNITDGMYDVEDIEVNGSGSLIVYKVKGVTEYGDVATKVIFINGFTISTHFIYEE